MLRLADELDGGKHAYSMNVLTVVGLLARVGIFLPVLVAESQYGCHLVLL